MDRLPRFTIAALVVALMLGAVAVGLVGLGLPVAEAQEPQEQQVIDTGPGTKYIEPRLWGLMYRHAAEEDGLPANVEIKIDVHPDVTLDTTLKKHVTDAGGSHVTGNIWTVPTGALAGLVQRSDVRGIKSSGGDGSGRRRAV